MMIFTCIFCGSNSEVNVSHDLGTCTILDEIPYMYKLCLDGIVFYCKDCKTYNRVIYDMKEDKLVVIEVGGE